MRSSSPPPSPHPAPLPVAASSLMDCPELDISVTLHHAPETSQPRLRPPPPLKGQARRKRDTQACSEEAVVVRGQSRGRGRRHAPRCSEPPVAAANQEPSCLERAELNTTLALKTELQSLQGARFDSQRAVQETLRRSERTKNLINTRATEVVNVSRSQLLFTSLASVDVREDQLISQVLQDRLQSATRPCCHDSRAADGPAPLAFMSSDLLRQKPLPPEEEPLNSKLRPSPRPAHSTFDLYRQQRRWEATP